MTSAAPAAARRGTDSPTRLGLLLGYVAGTSGLGLAAAPIVGREIAADLHLATAQTAWVLALFSLALGVSTPIWGRLADLWGGRRVVAAASACSVAGTVVVLAAPGFGLLLAGRVLQAVASAGLSLVAFSLPSHRLDPVGRARALGVLTAVSALTIGVGPLCGAVAEMVAGWRAALVLSVLMLAAAPALAALAEPPVAGASPRLDVRGAALVAGVASAASVLLQARTTGLSAAAVAVLAVAAGAGLVLLARHVRRRPAGFLPLSLVRNRVFLALSASAAALMGGFLGMGFLAPLLLTEHADRSALAVGVLLLPGAVCAAGTAHLVGVLRARVSAERILIALGALAGAGMAWVAVGPGGAASVIAASAVATSGFAGAQVALLDRIADLVAPPDRGVATGVFNLLFVSGGAAGAALAGTVAGSRSASAAALACAVVALAAIPAALAARRAA